MEYLTEQGRSKTGTHQLLLYRSAENPLLCFKFQWIRTNKTCYKYICQGCKSAKDAGNSIVVSSIGVSLDRTQFLANPEDLNHQCIRLGYTFDYVAADVQQELRIASEVVKNERTKPSIALANLRNTIQQKYEEDSQEALLTLPSRRSTLQTLSRKCKLNQPANFDPLNPPEDLYTSKLTHEGQQNLLLRSFSAVNPPFMYLADRTNLESLRSAEVLMFDGTFDYCPREFYRIDYEINDDVKTTSGETYTMHAVYSDLPERQSSFLCGIAFLPHKSKAAYVRLFHEIRNALEVEFGDIGRGKVVMMDFEIAAHRAIQEVFPEWTIKTCYFHFVKNIQDQAKKKKVPKMLRKTNEYKQWIGSVFLEVDAARQVFTYLLHNLPVINANLSSFVHYLRTFWLPKLDKVCCWDDTQPRTNNPAEAYHSKLQKSFQHEEHPQVGVAFEVHSGHLGDAAIEFLKVGGDRSKLQIRTTKQRKMDKKLIAAKDKLVVFANSLRLDQNVPLEYLLTYCRHIRFLTNKSKNGSARTNPDAKLNFAPLPEPSPRPVLQRPLLRPNVINQPLTTTPSTQAISQRRVIQLPANS